MSKMTIAEVNSKIEKHEAVCAERWRETIYRIKRLEILILTTLLSIVAGMAGILSRQVF
tara:strand:+ start:313 stop:489 length:177 start_codon:yes stop_codon:yes gene_type:complete